MPIPAPKCKCLLLSLQVEAISTPVPIAYDVEFGCGVNDSSGSRNGGMALQNLTADRAWQVFIQ